MPSAGPKEIPRSGQDAAAIFRPLRMAIFAREPTPIKTGSAVFHGGALPPFGSFRTPETPRRRGRRRCRDNRAFRLTADSTPQVAIFPPNTALRVRIRLRNPTKKSSARETRRAVPFQHCRNMLILLGIRPHDIHVAQGDLNVAAIEAGTRPSWSGLSIRGENKINGTKFGSRVPHLKGISADLKGRYLSFVIPGGAVKL